MKEFPTDLITHLSGIQDTFNEVVVQMKFRYWKSLVVGYIKSFLFSLTQDTQLCITKVFRSNIMVGFSVYIPYKHVSCKEMDSTPLVWPNHMVKWQSYYYDDQVSIPV